MSTYKIDPTHPLANRTIIKRLTGGALGSMTNVQNCAVVDSRFASTGDNVQAFAREALPAEPGTCRVSAVIRVDKSAASGRYAYVGVCTTASPTTSTASAEIGYRAGVGLEIRSQGLAFLSSTLVADADLVDGAEYRVALVYDNEMNPTSATRNRWYGAVQRTDGTTPPMQADATIVDRRWSNSAYAPNSLVARTTLATGSIRDLQYADHMLAASDDEALFRSPYVYMGDGSDSTDRASIWSKGFASPLRFVVWAGGNAQYGGLSSAGGYGTSPHTAYREVFNALANAGYTVLIPNALHEGWGADDHLGKQLELINTIAASAGVTDHRIYYLGYSMGGVSLWRALMGRGGYPKLTAAYVQAGIIDIDANYDVPLYADIQDRWPVRAEIDDPRDYTGAELVARDIRLRWKHSTADINVPKDETYDIMAARYAAESAPPELFESNIVTGISHLQDEYWDPEDIVDFYDRADTAASITGTFYRAESGVWTLSPRSLAVGGAWASIADEVPL